MASRDESVVAGRRRGGRVPVTGAPALSTGGPKSPSSPIVLMTALYRSCAPRKHESIAGVVCCSRATAEAIVPRRADLPCPGHQVPPPAGDPRRTGSREARTVCCCRSAPSLASNGCEVCRSLINPSVVRDSGAHHHGSGDLLAKQRRAIAALSLAPIKRGVCRADQGLRRE